MYLWFIQRKTFSSPRARLIWHSQIILLAPYLWYLDLLPASAGASLTQTLRRQTLLAWAPWPAGFIGQCARLCPRHWVYSSELNRSRFCLANLLHSDLETCWQTWKLTCISCIPPSIFPDFRPVQELAVPSLSGLLQLGALTVFCPQGKCVLLLSNFEREHLFCCTPWRSFPLLGWLPRPEPRCAFTSTSSWS